MVAHRVRFCWICGNKLWGKHKAEIEVDGVKRTVHKQCAKEHEKDMPDNIYPSHGDPYRW